MSRSTRRILLACACALAVAALLIGCGGGGGSSDSGSSPAPSPTPQNPCAAVAQEADEWRALPDLPERPKPSGVLDGDPQWNIYTSLWKHRAALERGLLRALAPLPLTEDVGEIAVIQDEGDVVLSPNQFDLRTAGLRFTRNAAGGYDVTRIDGTFRSPLGSQVTLQDDDSASATVAFGFPFYGRSQTDAFINSDGNVTFEEADRASTDRDVSRLLSGPPRVAPFFADLDPSVGGKVFVQSGSSAFTVTWCSVRGFESQRITTVQATLLSDGSVEMKFGDDVNLFDAVVGLSPGRTGVFTPVDLSASGPTPGGSGAVAERFAQRGELDDLALARKFYSTHPDNYDQLVIWTDTALTFRAFAYEFTVANEIRGIGLPVYDASREYGSGGRLRSIVVMDYLAKYPDDPSQKFLGENNTLSIVGQEAGHRWLAFMRFRDHNGQRSDALLGRDMAHWSFFMDSDASVLEGNDIEDLGGGSFRTLAAVQRFSALDQYAMGLLRESAVPTFFYVADPTNVTPFQNRDSDPRVGVTFNGTRRDVLIQDIVAIHGARQPTAAETSPVHRQAFIYVVSRGASTDRAQVDKLDRIRREWETFYSRATDSRGRAETRLRPS